jgi:hypothetical protein
MKIEIVCLALSLFAAWGCKRAQPAVYLIPGNYEGVIAVVYGQKTGTEGKIINGKRQFIIPDNGILLTQFDYSEGGRNDLFLVKKLDGYDTLKNYLPNKDTTGRKFGGNYYSFYTSDSNEVAVNYRQIINFGSASSHGGKPCNFEYELTTIGKASTLNDSAGKLFITNLDKYLQDSVCK